MPKLHTPVPQFAVGCLLAVVGGLVLPKAAFVSLDRAIIVWIVIVVAIGLALGAGIAPNVRRLARTCLAPAALFPITLVGFIVVRLLADITKQPNIVMSPNGTFAIETFSGAVAPRNPIVLGAMGVLAAIVFLATYLLVFLSAVATGPIIAAVTTFNFGPQGINRIRAIVISASALVAAVLLLWSAVG